MPIYSNCDPDYSSPNAFRNGDVLTGVSINALHEREVRVETLDGEESVHERVEKPLVKVVVNSTSIDTLGEEGSQGAPGDLVWRQVGATLWREGVLFLSRWVHVHSKGTFCKQFHWV